ncbi:putative late blight resistance protein-like R1A-3 [Vitis vinifera]|uniref:Putative late blight resistance protein-like R1A-3 n=1 Tax=Vitis vinifera TaxID=29760 RepID=A0A438CHE0_VITVI|nr:putative late blight resistance protein-like R1A-3 [Vitis vinifera]
MFKLWVNQIRDAAYDVEDVIDEFMFQVERKRQQRFNNLKFLNFLHVCMCLHDKLPLVNELNERISVINRTLENILINRRRKEKRFPIVKETNVVGMKNDVEAIKGKLLRSYFPAESNKSRVLITTRREDIVVDAHSDCYKLQLLGEKESWDLFLNKVGIATILTWPGSEEFKKRDCSKMQSPAFLLWGLSGDSEIKASELIRLWVAEGFVQKRGKETQEDIAEDYLYELIQRSMIQVADTRDDERVKSCRIHDLLRDLAISEAKEEKLFEVDENIDVDMLPTSVRRLIDNINQTNSPHLILNKSIDEGDEQMRHLNCFNDEISSRQPMRERFRVFLRPQVPLHIVSSRNHPETTCGNNTLPSKPHATQTVENKLEGRSNGDTREAVN